MKPAVFAAPAVLSAIIALLAAGASVGGLFIGVYRDNPFVVSAWLANDLVTLVLVVPVLVTSTLLSLRGPRRALLFWMGLLTYMLYNYAFYLC